MRDRRVLHTGAVATIEHATELGTILGVWAHPDDEAYLSGALMASAVDAAQRVVCVTATRGEAGFDDLDQPLEERRAIRERELAACLAELGVTEHHWLDEADGGMADADPSRAIDSLCGLLEEVRPDTVLTFGPDGMTGHGDHVAISRWTTIAVDRVAPATRLLYATKTTDWHELFFRLVDPGHVMMIDGYQPPSTPAAELSVSFTAAGALLERKLRALMCQESQVRPLAEQAGDAGFRALTRDEWFRSAAPGDWPDLLA